MSDLTLKEAADFIDEELKFVGDMLEPEAEQAYSIAVDCLRKAASGEYKPVVHAHWIKMDEDYSGIWKCSHCGLIWELSNDDTPQENEMFRCPKCGAVMDERGGKQWAN